MIRINDINLPLDYTEKKLAEKAAAQIGLKPTDLSGIKLVKRSVDARKKNNVHFTASVECSVKNEDNVLKKYPASKVSPVVSSDYTVHTAKNKEQRTAVVGFGPAGMFAALTLAEAG
ncbi:MAG: hypothetical protein ACI4KR_07165 [Ruminiclostridium sp.]